MLNRAFFDSLITRLSTFLTGIRPLGSLGSTRGKAPLPSAKPEISHRLLSEEYIRKFDEVIIIGDIHGCFDEFMLLIERMAAAKENHKRILKICAGDLVNKGPKNKEVLDYMMTHTEDCLAVRGNHDEVVIREYAKYLETGDLPEKNSWMRQLSKSHLAYLTQLPYTISIPSLNVIIVHAGLVPDLPLESQEMGNMVSMRNLVEATDNQEATGDRPPVKYEATSKGSTGQPWASLWTGPSHIFFGHDAARKLQEYPYATGLDTGVVYGGSLTAKYILGPRKGDYLSVKATKVWKDPFQEKAAH